LKTNNLNKKTNSSIYDNVENPKTIEKHDKTYTPRVSSVFDKYHDILKTKMANDKDDLTTSIYNLKGKGSKGILNIKF
jgi:hypothetical protein